METSILVKGEETIIAIEGRVDTVTAATLEKTAHPYLNESNITLVFDCEKMAYVSSSGLRVILMSHKQVTAKGGKFILRNLNPEVRSVIDMTGFSRILTID